jgi:hypothetical protein
MPQLIIETMMIFLDTEALVSITNKDPSTALLGCLDNAVEEGPRACY